MLGQSSSESSGLSVSEIVGSSALLVVLVCLVGPLLVDHSKHLSNGLSHDLKSSISSCAPLTLMRASLTWGADETLLTLS